MDDMVEVVGKICMFEVKVVGFSCVFGVEVVGKSCMYRGKYGVGYQ